MNTFRRLAVATVTVVSLTLVGSLGAASTADAKPGHPASKVVKSKVHFRDIYCC